jgi:hypothetical protein
LLQAIERLADPRRREPEAQVEDCRCRVCDAEQHIDRRSLENLVHFLDNQNRADSHEVLTELALIDRCLEADGGLERVERLLCKKRYNDDKRCSLVL